VIHGAASSSLQCEGAAPASDWGGWEAAGWVPPSGDGNDFALRYHEDAPLLAEHGLGSLRLTIEWARLEPKEAGRFLPDEVARYRAILQSIRAAGLEAWVCLAHTSLPGWFSEDARGFLDRNVARRVWPAHVDRVAEAFGDLVDGWVTFHEPVKYALDGYLTGAAPPGRTDGDDVLLTLKQLFHADAHAARLLHVPGGAPVASCHWLPPIFPIDGTNEARKAAATAEELIWRSWRDHDDHDLLGVSCSYAIGVGPDGSFNPWPASAAPGPMGWAPWHLALEHALGRIAEERGGRPLVVTTGAWGAADEPTTDRLTGEPIGRLEVLRDVAAVVADAASSLPVEQVHWWSAIDGYEGRAGFDVQSGLFDRDRNPTGITSLDLPTPTDEEPEPEPT
jgi:beta-glucosidase